MRDKTEVNKHGSDSNPGQSRKRFAWGNTMVNDVLQTEKIDEKQEKVTYNRWLILNK